MDASTATLITAAVFAIPGIFALAAPEIARRLARAFPDNYWTGRLLSTIALAWAATLVYSTPLDFIAKFRIHLTIFLLVSIPLSWMWMKLLLAARSLGAIWCLLPAPVLVAVRFEAGNGRLIVVSLMYLMAIAGMFATFSPYLLRDAFFWFADGSNLRSRFFGLLFLIAGIAAAVSI